MEKTIKQLGRYTVMALFFLLLSIIITSTKPLEVRADYKSWIQDSDAYQDFYDQASIETSKEASQVTETEGFLAQQLGNLVHWVGAGIANSLRQNDIDLTIDGIVLGRLSQAGGVSYTGFELATGNVYGLVGATIYTVFRGFVFTGLFISFFLLLTKQIIVAGPKSREEFKQGIYSILVAFVMVYALPQITDLCLFIRDVFMYRLAQNLGTGNTSILDAIEAMYQDGPTLMKGVVYTATVGASIFYLKDYISIAIQQTILFGFYPLFNVIGSQKKKILTDWAALFFSNMLVPVIDIVCLLMPYMTINAFSAGAVTNTKLNFAQSLIVMMMIWTAKAARSQILRLFGNMTSTPAGRGMGAIAGMAGMMARSMMGGKSYRTGAEEEKGYADWKEIASEQAQTAENMNKQAEEITKGLPDINDKDTSYEENAYAESDLLGTDHAGTQTEESMSAEDADIETEPADFVEDAISDEADTQGDARIQSSDFEEDADRAYTESFDEFPDMEETDLSHGDVADIPADDFSDKMTDFEKQRYENLTAIGQEKDHVREAESSLRGLQNENTDIKKAMDEKVHEKNEMLLRNPDAQTTELDSQIESLRSQKDANEQQIQKNQQNLAVSKENIETRLDAEKSYGMVAKEHGKNGTTYSSSADFRRSVETRYDKTQDAIAKAKDNAKVFMDDLKDFSPEASKELADIQAENMRRKNIRQAANKAVKAGAIVVGGTVGGSIAAYGGEGSTLSGAVLGAMGSGAVYDSGRAAMNKAPQLISSAGEQVKDAGEHIYSGTKKMEQEISKLQTRHAQKEAEKKMINNTSQKVENSSPFKDFAQKPETRRVLNDAYNAEKKSGEHPQSQKESEEKIEAQFSDLAIDKPETARTLHEAYQAEKKQKHEK